MILYIDETENEKYFIVAGLLIESERSTIRLYKSFKKDIKDYKISNKLKTKIYTEFKSTILDSRFQRIKRKMLETISATDIRIVYSAFKKENSILKQSLKEKIYIDLLNSIIEGIDEEINVVYDRFGISSFETTIEDMVSKISGVKSITAGDSQLIPGLQFADNICSVIRLKISENDKNNYYPIIEKLVYYTSIIDNIIEKE